MQVHSQDNFTYEIVITGDSSPSLVMTDLTALEMHQAETMHSRHGALTESLYIYFENMNCAFEKKWPLRVLSVGLGLGYNEALLAALALQKGLSAREVSLCSYEKVDEIRNQYLAWLTNSSAIPFWSTAFSHVTSVIETHFHLPEDSLRSFLKELFHAEQFIIKSDLLTEDWAHFSKPFSSILFDAFSKKSTPDLWDENFLNLFLAKAAGPQCLLSTYAATGALNRSLRKNGFQLVERKGFVHKRESTWALRGE